MTPALAGALAEYHAVSNLRTLQAASRRFLTARAEASGPPPGSYPRRVALLGNYSTQFLAMALVPALAERRVWAEVWEGGYNQWEPALLSREHPVYEAAPDLIVLALSSLELAFGGRSDPESIATRLAEAARAARRHSAATLIVTVPEPLPEETSSSSWAYEWRLALRHRLSALAGEIGWTLVDPEPLIRRIGDGRWFAPKFYVTSKLPFHPDCTHHLANLLADAVRVLVAPACKLVITDLDDTLWKGIVGEEGWAGVGLDAGGSGHPHLRLQRFLKSLRESGVLLAVASKNERQAVLEVFRRRPEMILGEADFVAMAVDWEPKSKNVQGVLARLNLSPEGVVFLDDSALERDEVRQLIPEIDVPDLPADPGQWVPELCRSGRFERAPSTTDGVSRHSYYEADRAREQQRLASGDYETYLNGLGMRLIPEDLEPNRERVLELIGRTNQFNLTTRRHGWARIVELLAGGGRGYCFRLEDRHGDYGLISVLIVVPEGEEGIVRIDTWVMSCRVMGRTVERAILRYLLADLAQRGIRRVVGEYVESGKNAPVAGLLPSLGFAPAPPNGAARVAVLDLPHPELERLGPAIEVASPVAWTPR